MFLCRLLENRRLRILREQHNSTSSKELPKAKQNQALAWRSKCMVQYGIENNVGDFDSWFVAHETSDNKTKDVQGLEKTMKVLVDKLSKEAMTKNNYYYAYGTMPYGSRQTLFMVSGATAAATITTGCYMRYAHNDFRIR
ncbi:hypothetical protein Hdeb2414_s0006g00194151 [Helianthus debilis subsp. tardiflorus]